MQTTSSLGASNLEAHESLSRKSPSRERGGHSLIKMIIIGQSYNLIN